MIIGEVRADQQNYVGGLHIFVSAGRAVATERNLVTGDGAGHAERGVAIVIIGAEAELNQLAERIEFFGDQLPGAQYTQRFRPIRLLRRPEAFGHHGQCFIPTDAHQLAVLAQQWVLGSIL